MTHQTRKTSRVYVAVFDDVRHAVMRSFMHTAFAEVQIAIQNKTVEAVWNRVAARTSSQVHTGAQ